MPNRIIREGILSSEKIAQLSWAEEVFYRRLQSIVDDYGRYEANPQLLRSKCYPLHTDASVKAKDVAAWLSACQKAKLVQVYEVGGKTYLQVLNFGQQQRTKSKCPCPPAIDSKGEEKIGNEHLDVFVFGDVSEDGDGARKRAPPVDNKIELPDWLPGPQWEAFVAMRRAKGKRAPFTVAAAKGILAELERLRSVGHDPGAVLQASVNSGWSGVFPLKADAAGTPGAGSWWSSRAGVERKGMEFGLPAPPRDDMNHRGWYEFQANVWAKAGEGEWLDNKSPSYPIYQKLMEAKDA